MKTASVLAGLTMAMTGLMVPATSAPSAAAFVDHNVVEPLPDPDRQPTTVTLSAPSFISVLFGKPVEVTGTVTGGVDTPRTVRLDLATKRGWMPLTTVKTASDGTYASTVPTNWYFVGTMRAFAPGTETHLPAASPATFSMSVKPSYKPLGRPGDHVLIDRDYRWNPCEVIAYKVNSTGAPKGALRMVKKTMALTARATGFSFRYAGSTRAIAWRDDKKGKTWSDAPLTISWGTDRQARGLRGNVVGLGGWKWGISGEILKGGVVLDRSAKLRRGFGGGPTWGTLLLHEVGHAMNLQHAQGAEQVMHSGLNARSQGTFQAGDLAGLAKTGAMGGCWDGDDSMTSARGGPVVVNSHPLP